MLCIITVVLLFWVESLLEAYDQGCLEKNIANSDACNKRFLNSIDFFRDWFLITWLVIAPICYSILTKKYIMKLDSKD
jgi:hypothetical protein